MLLARPEDKLHLPLCNVKISGTQVTRPVMDDLLECTVESSLHLPDVCTLRFHDGKFQHLDSALFKTGNPLLVQIGNEKAPLTTVFEGEITGLEMDLAASGVPTVIVRGMDRSHRLHRGRYQRSFVQMKDSDIVRKIAQEAGFQVQGDATAQVHDWVFQNNQSNWDFLSERAARNGFRLWVSGQNHLHFEKVKDGATGALKMEYGSNLRSFRPRVSAGGQMKEVIVRGWDPLQKKAIIGKCGSASGLPQTTGAQAAKSGKAGEPFAAARLFVVDQPVHTQGEADDLARSLFDEVAGEYLEAEGLCYGAPQLTVGMQADVPNIGAKFSGKYLVTSLTHVYTPAEGYTTLFSATGKRSGTLLSALGADGGAGAGAGGRHKNGGVPASHIVIGIVTDNNDPKKLGRVKVKYPHLTEEHASFWARQAAPMAGPGRGFYFVPEINDEVLVAWEHGDIHRPYIIGALWNGKDAPVEPSDKAVKGGKVERRTIRTRIGHTVLLEDTNGEGEMSLTTKGRRRVALDDKNRRIEAVTADGHQVVLDDKNRNITAKTKAGHEILLDDRGRKIVVQDSTGKNKITIETTSNAMQLECVGNFTVKAQGKVDISGQLGVDVHTPMKLHLQGLQAEMQGSAQAAITAPMVKIN